MALALQYTLINDTPADAGPPEANFARIEQYVNQETIQRNGTVAMTSQLKLIGDPVEALDAAPKQYVDTFIPIGSILMFGGDAAPPGGKWALCNGAEMEIASYPALYALYGTKYGGTTGHFNLPNLASRFPIGAGMDALGVTGGSRDAAVVSHTHPIDHLHAVNSTSIETAPHNHNDDHAHSGTTAGANTRHHHGMGGVDHSGSGFDGLPLGRIGDITNYGAIYNTGDDTPDHAHAFNTNFKSQQGYGTTTGNENQNHGHTSQTPAYSGQSGISPGAVAPTDANLPPYLVINFIVRIG